MPHAQSVHIRSWRPEDQQAVLRLYTQGLLEGRVQCLDAAPDLHDVPQTYMVGDPGNHFWVAQIDAGHAASGRGGEVVGMVGVAHREPRIGHIQRLRVDPHWRDDQHGLVVALVDTALRHCRELGDLKVVLDTHLDADRAMALIDGQGFQYGRRKARHDKQVLEFYTNIYQEPAERLEVEAK